MKKTISGIRGVVGDDFTLKDVLKFCNNFSVLVDSKKCVIANDTRPSGNMVRETAIASLLQNGIDVYNLGIAPTPVVFREARKYGSGIVITSSHNPLPWNGLKFIVNGRGINEKELEKVTTDQKTSQEKISTENFTNSDYVQDAISIIGKKAEFVKVTVDLGGGAAKNYVKPLLEKLGCKVRTINENLKDSSRDPDPINDELKDLIANNTDRDIGFAFDLDGDRLVVVKDNEKLSPDVTLGLGVGSALDRGYKKFVISIDTSISIEKLIKENGGSVERSKVGEANVIDLMLKTKSEAGGEGSSGGFILPEFNYCRDGILTSGLISTMLHEKRFNEILDFMKGYHQVRNKIAVDSKLHDKIVENLIEKIQNQYSEIITIDGIKGIVDENSWVLFRKSNTEDVIRISSESEDKEKSLRINEQAKNFVKQCHDEIK